MAKPTLKEMAASELVKYHLDQALEVAAILTKTTYHEFINHHLNNPNKAHGGPFESPLEMVFWAWFKALECQAARPFSLWRQFEIEIDGRTYRADFAVADWREELGSASPLLLVDVDGHAFHERTPEQVATRDSRDRALLLAGYKVLHFSYQELTTRSNVPRTFTTGSPVRCCNRCSLTA